MTTDPNDTRPPHAPDYGFVSRGSVFALCRCGALQIVDPARTRHARSWLQERGWSRPPTNLASPDDGWFCPACTTRTDTTPLAAVVTVDRHVELLEARLAEAEAERDTARRDLARIVQLCGWDCDGNDPESPSGAIHLYGDAVQAVRELVEERAEDSAEIASPSLTICGALVRGPICGAVVREWPSGTFTASALCPLPPGHDGDHAETLAGGD